MSELSNLRSDASQTISNYTAETKRVLGDYRSTAKDALDTHRRTVTRAFERRLGGTGDGSAAGRSASSEDEETEGAGSDDANKWGDTSKRDDGDSDDGSTDATTGESAPGSEHSGEDERDDSESAWDEADSPTTKALTDVVATDQGPFAVGSDGNLLARADGEWRFVVEAGPAAKRNRLTAADATTDGKRVWFAGASGALGHYDRETGEKHDYSAPKGKTSTWEGIAVTGTAGGRDPPGRKRLGRGAPDHHRRGRLSGVG